MYVIIVELDDVKYVVEEVVRDWFDLVVVVGGDGIINEVINGIVEKEYCFKVGIILIGIINDFVRVLYVFRDVIKVMKIIVVG